jgi:pyruvate kinase
MIELCRSRGKVVIVATQMLDSMIHNPRPTRAEASDVANAVMDGTDAVMLSGESASGAYPVESVATMRRIVDRAEKELGTWGLPCRQRAGGGVTDAVSDAAVLLAKQVKAAGIISLTKSGTTARMISKHRPSCPILGVTPSRSIWRELALWWGVHPVKLREEFSNVDVAAREAIGACIAGGHIRTGELAVITAGLPLGLPGSTNMVEVLTTGNVLLSGLAMVKKNAVGKVCVVSDLQKEKEKISDGCVLVVRRLDEEYRAVIGRVGAVLSESDALNFEGSAWVLEHDVPCIVEVSDALATLSDGMEVTVDGVRGLIYEGRVELIA